MTLPSVGSTMARLCAPFSITTNMFLAPAFCACPCRRASVTNAMHKADTYDILVPPQRRPQQQRNYTSASERVHLVQADNLNGSSVTANSHIQELVTRVRAGNPRAL